MSSDGCFEVAWKGQAFPYLLHHPADPARSESYGSAREAAKPEEPPARQVAKGVWNGHAPPGSLAASEHGKTITPTASPRKVPRHAILGQLRMPMIVLDTVGISGAQLTESLQAGFCGLLCSAGSNNLSDIATKLSQFSGDKSSLFITVQVPASAAPENAAALAKEAMSALGVAKIDLVVVHVSSSTSATWAALEPLVEAGTVLALGLAGATLEQACEVMEGCKFKPVANFMELHPMNSERKAVGQMMRKGLQAVAMLPTGGSAGETTLQQHETVAQVAKESEHSVSEVLLKWSTQRGTPVVVDCVSVASGSLDVSSFFEWRMNEEKHKVLLDAMNQDKTFA